MEVHQLSHHSTTDVCIQFRIFFVRTTYAMVSKERLKCLLCEDDEQEGRALGHQKAGDPWLPPSKWTCKDDANDDDDGMAPLTKKTTGYDIKTTYLNGKCRHFWKRQKNSGICRSKCEMDGRRSVAPLLRPSRTYDVSLLFGWPSSSNPYK